MNNSHLSAAADCPTMEVLIGFGSGELADPAFETVASHLSKCDKCLAVVAELHTRSTADFFEDRVRDCLVEPALRETLTHADAAGVLTAVGTDTETAPAVGPDRWVGQTVGRYRIQKRLGDGGMGVVYLAEDPAVGRAVALKMISAEALPKADRLARFRAEGRALARVRHPNVVQFFHFDEHAGVPYYTMEYVAGESLAARLPDHPLPVRDAVTLVRTVAAAVQAVHGQGLIHRDIKPSNIMIAADGTPKVADFGLAKLADAAGQSDRTHTGVILGTPSYMAPEQAEGRVRDIDARADVYALGAVLYAALTGRPPHKGKSVRETLRLVAGAIPAPPSAGRPGVPKVLDRICEKCLQKAPGRRYATAQALADDLADWLAGRPPRGLPGTLGRALRPTRRQALAAGLAAAAAAAGVAVYRRDPDVALRGLTADLQAGKAVTLIGATGAPAWFQWVAGKSKGKWGLADDGVFTVTVNDDAALVELAPDPQTDSYRLTAEVRHDAAARRTLSDAGLYVARRGEAAGDVTVHCFLQLAYNDIRTAEDEPLYVVGGVPDRRPRVNEVMLRPRVFADPTGPWHTDRTLTASARKFPQAGEAGGHWRTLEIVVTPDGFTAAWDGLPMALAAGAVRRELADSAAAVSEIPAAPPAFKALTPTFAPRGGLGLLVAWGTASFRSVTVTPL